MQLACRIRALLECPICHNVMSDPVAVAACGHVFCRACINTVIEYGASPPRQRPAPSRQDEVAGDDAPQLRRKRCRRTQHVCPQCGLPAFKWTLVELPSLARFMHQLQLPPISGPDPAEGKPHCPDLTADNAKLRSPPLPESTPLFPESLGLEPYPQPVTVAHPSTHSRLGSMPQTVKGCDITSCDSIPSAQKRPLIEDSPIRVACSLGPCILLDEGARQDPSTVVHARDAARLLGGVILTPHQMAITDASLWPLPTHCVCSVSTSGQYPAVESVSLAKCIVLGGVYIVTVQWITDSTRLGHWQPEEQYEVTDTAKHAQLLRMRRLAVPRRGTGHDEPTETWMTHWLKGLRVALDSSLPQGTADACARLVDACGGILLTAPHPDPPDVIIAPSPMVSRDTTAGDRPQPLMVTLPQLLDGIFSGRWSSSSASSQNVAAGKDLILARKLLYT